jgi:hypothetical protein
MFCINICETAAEFYHMLNMAFREEAMSRTQTTDWLKNSEVE